MSRLVLHGLICAGVFVGLVLAWMLFVRQESVQDPIRVSMRVNDDKANRSTLSEVTPRRVRHSRSPGETPRSKDLDEEEEREEEFDALTDELIASETELTIDDVERFSRAFKRIPPARRDGCLHRALNLLPDEKIILCTGILMDKGMDPVVVRIVFDDILNRQQSVKKPILDEIYKEKAHPCYSDVEWIFEVTGEKPE